jgi:hypothetical protein
MTAIIKGYHDRPTQLLLREDIALIVWGGKITGDISGPLQFHASKTVAIFPSMTNNKDTYITKGLKKFTVKYWNCLISLLTRCQKPAAYYSRSASPN